MTDNDIIKALECCQYEGVETCRDCPMFYTHEFDNEIDFDCGKYIYGRALDLINRLQAVITEKDEIIKAQADTIFLYERVTKGKNTTIERLKDKLFLALHTDTAKRNIEAEAIKGFAERLKDVLTKKGNCIHFYGLKRYDIAVYDIDNLVKEMTEVNENGKV